MTEQELRIIAVIADQLGIDSEIITSDKRLADDFGANSLDVRKLFEGLEDEFKFDTELADEACKTVQDVFNLITRTVKS